MATNIQDLLGQARDSITVSRVFGEPYQHDGITIIPVAKLTGGAGGGTGENHDQKSGVGGGFGIIAQPAGVYVIKNGKVNWQPALNVNRIVTGAQIVIIVFLLVVRSIVRAQAQQRAAMEKP